MSGTTELECHCRWLMLAYPRRYRQERADEILGTLLEVAGSDRSWPTSRDARALILGGLRVRAGLGQRLTARANLTQSLLLTAVLVLSSYSAFDFGFDAKTLGATFPSALTLWLHLGLGLAALATMLGVWFGPAKVVGVAAIAFACLWIYPLFIGEVDPAVQSIAAFAFIAVLAFRRQRLPRSWLWLAGAWYLMYLVAEEFLAYSVQFDLVVFGSIAIVGATIVWCVLDVRPMLAVGLATAIFYGATVLSYTGFRPARLLALWQWDIIAVISLVLAVVASWRLRRQALL